MRPKILLNMAYCPQCDQILLSLHRHDFRMCEGGHGFVDGGTAYLRRGGTPLWEFSVYLKDGKIAWADSDGIATRGGHASNSVSSLLGG